MRNYSVFRTQTWFSEPKISFRCHWASSRCRISREIRVSAFAWCNIFQEIYISLQSRKFHMPYFSGSTHFCSFYVPYFSRNTHFASKQHIRSVIFLEKYAFGHFPCVVFFEKYAFRFKTTCSTCRISREIRISAFPMYCISRETRSSLQNNLLRMQYFSRNTHFSIFRVL